MKKFLIYIPMILLALSSCNKQFLNLSPETVANANDFFKTADQFRQAVIGAYVPLRSLVGTSGYCMGEMRSDNTKYTYYGADRGQHNVYEEQIAYFGDDDQNQWTNGYYDASYVGIARCNTIISRLTTSNIDDSDKTEMMGEALFLRAYYYFNLVRYFGGVPLQLKEVTSSDGAFLPRSSADSVYSQIIMDATKAVQDLPVVQFPQSGHVTKGTAETLLAKVYMELKEYSKAEPLLKDVTTQGYTLLPDYASVYDPANKFSKESIFEVGFQSGNQGQQSEFIYWFMPKTDDTYPVTGFHVNNLTIGGWNVPTQDILDAYEPGDDREAASIAIAEGVLGPDGNLIIQSIKSPVGYQTPFGKVSRPFIIKYDHPNTSTLPYNTDDDWPIYRYSDVLLLLAECMNEEGNSAAALPYLNEVRARAGLGAVTLTDQNILRDTIRHERRIELAFENHRWNDLVRWGTAVSTMTAFGEKVKPIENYLPPNAYDVQSFRLLYPIPYTELQLNNKLTQNPGY